MNFSFNGKKNSQKQKLKVKKSKKKRSLLKSKSRSSKLKNLAILIPLEGKVHALFHLKALISGKKLSSWQGNGRSHDFESERAQSPKAILGPFCLKKWEGPSVLLLLYGQKSGGQPPISPLGDYGPA